jgi:hypothetical protein
MIVVQIITFKQLRKKTHRIRHGMSLEKGIEELHFWGLAHRKKIIGTTTKERRPSN